MSPSHRLREKSASTICHFGWWKTNSLGIEFEVGRGRWIQNAARVDTVTPAGRWGQWTEVGLHFCTLILNHNPEMSLTWKWRIYYGAFPSPVLMNSWDTLRIPSSSVPSQATPAAFDYLTAVLAEGSQGQTVLSYHPSTPIQKKKVYEKPKWLSSISFEVFFKYNCLQMELTGCLRNVLLKVNIVAEHIVQTPPGVTLRLLLSVSALSVLPLWLPVTHGVASAHTHTHMCLEPSALHSTFVLPVELLHVLPPPKKSKSFTFLHKKPLRGSIISCKISFPALQNSHPIICGEDLTSFWWAAGCFPISFAGTLSWAAGILLDPSGSLTLGRNRFSNTRVKVVSQKRTPVKVAVRGCIAPVVPEDVIIIPIVSNFDTKKRAAWFLENFEALPSF